MSPPPTHSAASDSRLTWWLLKLLLIAYAFNWFSLITADTDLWGKIAFGGEIWNSKSIPTTNGHSFTAESHPFYNHEWLADVIFYLIFLSWGSTGLLIFKMSVGLVLVGLLSFLYTRRSRNPLVYLIYFFILIPILAPGFMTRAHLFTFLCLALLISLLNLYFDGNKRAIYWAPLLVLFWVNCHGGVIAGMGIFAVATMVDWLRCRIKRLNEDNTLVVFFFLSCLMLFINPYGYHLLTFLYTSLSLPRRITEWYPLPIWTTGYLGFKVLAVLFILTIILPVKKRLWEVFTTALAILFAFKHIRHTVLAAVVMTPYLPAALTSVSDRWLPSLAVDRVSSAVMRFIQCVLIVVIGLNVYVGVKKNARNDFKIIVEPQVYPSYAVQFMNANGIRGNIWVPFDWGDYIIMKLPESKVSIDGRFRAAYPGLVLDEHTAFLEGRPGWQTIPDKYSTDYILTRRKNKTHLLLNQHPGWLKIYEDPIAFLYVRVTEPPGRIETLSKQNQLITPSEPPSLDFP